MWNSTREPSAFGPARWGRGCRRGWPRRGPGRRRRRSAGRSPSGRRDRPCWCSPGVDGAADGGPQRAAQEGHAGAEQQLGIDVDAAFQPEAAPQAGHVMGQHPARNSKPGRRVCALGKGLIEAREAGQQGEDEDQKAQGVVHRWSTPYSKAVPEQGRRTIVDTECGHQHCQPRGCRFAGRALQNGQRPGSELLGPPRKSLPVSVERLACRSKTLATRLPLSIDVRGNLRGQGDDVMDGFDALLREMKRVFAPGSVEAPFAWLFTAALLVLLVSLVRRWTRRRAQRGRAPVPRLGRDHAQRARDRARSTPSRAGPRPPRRT